MSARAHVVAAAASPLPADSPFHNRFHLAAVAFLRAKQLQAGARPRVEARGRKVVTLALLEVIADTISWHVQ
ncbi:MAG TPA: DNA-directed RNA polymerase subunit omega [Vicinamibacteria bacterium]|nr:DNA-directed RNA polymerase subunit omega [Vicinamibacteria bacterium]